MWRRSTWRCVVLLVYGGGSCTDPAFGPSDAEVAAPSDAEVAAPSDAEVAPDSRGPDASVDEAGPSTFAGDTGIDGGEGPIAAPDAAPWAARWDGASADGSELTAPDAETASASLPAWTRPLSGRYLKRSVGLFYDEAILQPVISVDSALFVISETSSETLEITVQVCSFSTQWSDGSARLSVDRPDALPTATLRVLLGQEPHFSTNKVIQAVGYDPERQTACEGGAVSAHKYPDQTWIFGSSCSCPTTPEVLPLEGSDCRVVDADGDGQPGILLRGSGLASDISVVLNRSLKISDGEVRPDGEHVLQEEFAQNDACVGAACTPLGSPVPCALITELHPLDGPDAGCAEALALGQTLPIPPLPIKDCNGQTP